MFLRKTEHNIPEKRYPHTEGDFSLAGLSFREKIRKMRQDPRGIDVGQLVLIVVGVLAATALGVFIFNQVSDTGETIESAGSSEVLTYSADCQVSAISPVARVIGNGNPAAFTGTPAVSSIVFTLSRTLDESGENMELQHAGAAVIGNRDWIDAQREGVGTITVFQNNTAHSTTVARTDGTIALDVEDLNADKFNTGTGYNAINFALNTTTAAQTALNGLIDELEGAVIARNTSEGCWTITA